MAIIKLGALITGMSGKIGGQSISKRKQNIVIRNIVHTNQTPTIKQGLQRFLTANIASRYKFLSPTQKNQWVAAAPDYIYTNALGEVIERTAFGAYSYLNQNLELLKLPLRNSPPIYKEVFTPIWSIFSREFDTLFVEISNLDMDVTYILYAQPNMSMGATGQYGRMRYCGTISAIDFQNPVDILPLVAATFPPLNSPNNIGFMIEAIGTTTGNRCPEPPILTIVVEPGEVYEFDVDYQKILDFAALKGYSTPSFEVQKKQDALMRALKLVVPLSAFDLFFTHAGDGDGLFGWINWANPSKNSQLGTWTTITNYGKMTGRLPSIPFVSDYNPSIDAVAYTAGDASYGSKMSSNVTTTDTQNVPFTLSSGLAQIRLFDQYNKLAIINTTLTVKVTTRAIAGTLYDANRYNVVNRHSSTKVNLYSAGILYPDVNTTAGLIPTANLNFQTNGNLTDMATEFIHLGRSLTLAECQGLQSIMENYMASL